MTKETFVWIMIAGQGDSCTVPQALTEWSTRVGTDLPGNRPGRFSAPRKCPEIRFRVGRETPHEIPRLNHLIKYLIFTGKSDKTSAE